MPMPVVLYCILINRVLKLLVYFYIIVLLCFLLYWWLNLARKTKKVDPATAHIPYLIMNIVYIFR